MSIDFSTLTGLTIPEGEVTKIEDSSGNVLWELNTATPTAILYSDGTLVFQGDDTVDESHGTVVNTYTGWDTATYSAYGYIPWYNDRASVTSVIARDSVAVTSMGYMFRGCNALTSLDLSSFNTGNVTDMYQMFYACNALTSLDLSSFNTGKVTTMREMFRNCNALTSLDLSSFDTGNVTNMYYMFAYCRALTSLDLSSFNTGNVTNMAYMFYGCSKLTSLDLSSFNTGKVTSMSSMFYGCSASGFTIYVANSDMVTWVQSTSGFPSTATVVVGSM